MLRKLLLVVVLVVLGALVVLPAAAQDELVFGLVMVGFKDDKGWSQAHYEGAVYAQQQVPGSKLVYVENINAGNTEVTFEAAVDELVAQGASLIITSSDEFEEDSAKAATAYPDVTFVNISGDDAYAGTAPANLGNLMGEMEWGKMIAGCAAALATNSGKVSYLGPLINDETRRLVSSAYLGAKYCYENYAGKDPATLSFEVKWIGFWFNIPGVTLDPTEVVNSFIAGGSDVVISGIDTTEAIVVASQKSQENPDSPVYAVPYDYAGSCELGANICLGVPYFIWGGSYVRLLNAVKDGSWTQSWDLLGPDWSDLNNVDTSAVGFVFGEGLGEKKAQLESFIAELSAYAGDEANANTIFLWSGPLKYQDGTEVAAEGVTLPVIQPEADGPSVWYTKQLLEGLIGPSS
jgi:simple sugar transport system substrate-binding protein